MTYLIGLMLAVWVVALALLIYGTWLVVRHLKEEPPYLDAPFRLYPISILKPLKGVDPDLKRNLETFFHLDYPSYELLFSVADPRDPARFLAEDLMRSYPKVDAKLVIGDLKVGTNPKVNNLAVSYETAKYDWLLISDSNVKAEKDYLKRLTAQMDSGVGVITSLVMGQEASGFGSQLEEVFLNTFYVRGMLLAAKAGRPCVVGKSMLFRRSTADRFGGIQALAYYLAEDYMAGEAMRLLGQKIKISVDPIHQCLGKMRLQDVWLRHLRWGRIRKAQAPLAIWVEPISYSLVSGLLGAFALSWAFSLSAGWLFTAHLGIWLFCDLIVISALGASLDIRLPFVWLAREALQLPLWLHTVSGNTVKWRGRKFKIQTGGLVDYAKACQ